MQKNNIKLRNSVATSLIKHVFAIYFIVTILVTCIQLTVEYFHIKEDIINDIEKMEITFKHGLSEALWNYNDIQLQAIIMGMNELSIVVGVKIDKSDEKEFKGVGVILDKEKQLFITSDNQMKALSEKFTPLKGLFFHRFDIYHEDPLSSRQAPVGKATVYSYSGVVINRIKYGFFLIIINSIIKTAALWFIIFYYARRIIGKPLSVLTGTTEKMNPNVPDFFEIKYSPDENRLIQSQDELGILARSFDKMRNAILERIENLQKLKDVGEYLTVSRELSVTLQQVMKTMKEKFGFSKGSVFLQDDSDDKNLLKMAACYPGAPGNGNIYIGEGIIGNALEHNEIVYLSDLTEYHDFFGKDENESLLCIPLTDENGLIGAMFFPGPGGLMLNDENRVFLQAIARLAMISIKNIMALKIIEENTMLKQEMELAKHIQTVLLPSEPKITGYDISASLDPADKVGGGYYDVISVGGHDWLVIGDVSGHGVSAGLVMIMVQTAIHTVLLENPGIPPSYLLSVINKAIYQNIEKMGESKHMTIVVLAGGKEGYFSFSGSHEDILVWRADTGKVDEIETEGMWIGIEPDISKWLSSDSLVMDPGDCMVLFTDGITESVDKKGEMFGNERLIKIIEENGSETASELHNHIIKALELYDKPDDVTLLIIKRAE